MPTPDVTPLAATAAAPAATAALPVVPADPSPPGDASAVTPTTAAAGASGPDPAVLSRDEEDLLEHLISNRRNCNLYLRDGGLPHYRGWFYLTNVIWYLRTVYNKSGARLTPDQMASLKKDYAAPRNARVPANPTEEDPEIPREAPAGPPHAWNALLYGGVIPHAQKVLSRLRIPCFKDITRQENGRYESSSETRSYRAKHHGDPVKDAAADSRRLELLMNAVKYLGTEYQQRHPELQPNWKKFGRKLTLDCSGFISQVYADSKVLVDSRTNAVLHLGSQVSDHYFKAVSYPDTLRIVMGPRCKLLAGSPPRVHGSPLVEESVEVVPFDGTVLTGDLGLSGMTTTPHRQANGTIGSSFTHIVMFTGRKVGNSHEYIHASDVGEGVDFGVRSFSDFKVLIRPIF